MKKVGIIIFILAIVVGVGFANVFSFGKTSARFFNFQFDFGRVNGSGNIVNQKREVSEFTSVEVGGAFDVEIVAQKEFSLEVEGDDNLLEFVKTEVRGERLEISSEKSFSTKSRIKLRIGAPDIEKLDLSGASNVSLSNIKNESLRVESSGASKVKITGETSDFVLDLSGASKIDATELKAVNVSVDSSGASLANVFASGELKADLSGASKVVYSGNPKNVERHISGASSVSAN